MKRTKSYEIKLAPTIDDEITQLRATWQRRSGDIQKARAAIDVNGCPMQLAVDRAWLDELLQRRKQLVDRVAKSVQVESRLIEDWTSQMRVQRRMQREESADRFEFQIDMAKGRRSKWAALLSDIAPDRAAAVAS